MFSTSVFDPCDISPHPKAAERKSSKEGRKRRHSAILTDTPEKSALEQDNIRKILKIKVVGQLEKRDSKKSCVKNKKTGPTKSTKKTASLCAVNRAKEKDDCYCIMCGEPFGATRKKKEEWIQMHDLQRLVSCGVH